jgi:outer membrane immunogenic protein
MKQFLLATAGLVALAVALPASAADLKAPAPAAVAPIFSWTGFYVGGHVGWGWADSRSTVVDTPGNNLFPAGFASSTSLDGFIAGGQAGFNYQIGAFVLGVEGDISWSLINGETTNAAVLVANRFSTVSLEADRIAMVAGRLGFAFDNWLIYAKGGWAWVDFQSSGLTTNAAGAIIANTHGAERRDGFIIGGGVEWGFATNWSVKAEYNFIDLGTDRVTRTVLPNDILLRDLDTQIHLVKFGLNYRFNLFGAPAVPVRAAY